MPSIYGDDLEPLSPGGVKTYPLAARPSKVRVRDFAQELTAETSLRDFLAKLPNVLAVQSLRQLASSMRRARELHKPIIWGIGGHVLKTGLAPILLHQKKLGVVAANCLHRSPLLHDADTAVVGSTRLDL